MYGFSDTIDDKLIGRIYRLRNDPSRMFSVCLSPPPSSKLYLTSEQYEWKMSVLPPQKNDQMLQVMKKTIIELNKQYMLFWRIGLEVSHLTMSPPLWPRHLEEYSTKLYAFKEKDREFPMAVEATLSRGCRYLTADSILVRKKDDMNGPKPGMPLKSWVLSLVTPSDGLGENGWQLQRKWWASNGQSFPIMTGKIYPDARRHRDLQGFVVTLGSRCNRSPSRADPPNYVVLRANKQIHEEALKAAWEGTTKHFAHWIWLENVVYALNSPSGYYWLTHVQLCMSTSNCYEFLGMQVDPVLRLLPRPSRACMLQDIPTLKNLGIVFGTPYSYDSNPWFGTRRLDGLPIEQHPCHKIMVEWGLIFAFPYLKHIPNVRLTGCIKTSTKLKWENILSNEYYLRKKTYKTHGYDPAMEAYNLLEEQRPVRSTTFMLVPRLVLS
ncbi:hypothetical protein BKA58DRAFT_471887 [Alternaria rosae]|uniref:uncharacterized protein n=1 Tax=Alternaria rosae TaxID=1187941 RepID=UPI001E8E880F|nr:uncharacterized protein BKA58DRAFT_471887 [Alternaria rosae]KAH6865969.1 hypothetical protein BKA58DRAFT_471887 [Alternaria rosae]